MGKATREYKFIDVKPFSPSLGAEIHGVDLSSDLP